MSRRWAYVCSFVGARMKAEPLKLGTKGSSTGQRRDVIRDLKISPATPIRVFSAAGCCCETCAFTMEKRASHQRASLEVPGRTLWRCMRLDPARDRSGQDRLNLRPQSDQQQVPVTGASASTSLSHAWANRPPLSTSHPSSLSLGREATRRFS